MEIEELKPAMKRVKSKRESEQKSIFFIIS